MAESPHYKELLHTLNEFEVEYLVVGGYAVMKYTEPRYTKDEQVLALAHRVMAEVGRLPGVRSVAVAHQIPVADMAGGNTTFEIIGSANQQQGREANNRQVSANFFATIQARLLRGRWFSDADDKPAASR